MISHAAQVYKIIAPQLYRISMFSINSQMLGPDFFSPYYVEYQSTIVEQLNQSFVDVNQIGQYSAVDSHNVARCNRAGDIVLVNQLVHVEMRQTFGNSFKESLILDDVDDNVKWIGFPVQWLKLKWL